MHGASRMLCALECACTDSPNWMDVLSMLYNRHQTLGGISGKPTWGPTSEPCSGTVYAFNISNPDVLVLCSYLLDGKKKVSLKPCVNGQTAISNGKALDRFNSILETLYYEMMHLVRSETKYSQARGEIS